MSTCVVLDHWKDGGGEADTVPSPLTLAFRRRSKVEHSFPLWQVPGNESGAAFGSTRADKAAALNRRSPS